MSYDRRDSAAFVPKAVVTDEAFGWGDDRILYEDFGLAVGPGFRPWSGPVLGTINLREDGEDDTADYPELTEDDIRASLAYAADRERRLVTATT